MPNSRRPPTSARPRSRRTPTSAGATFTRNASFGLATFARHADFRGATFTRNASFSAATFAQDAEFRGATFTRSASFSAATFKGPAHFAPAYQEKGEKPSEFKASAWFNNARFADYVDFRGPLFGTSDNSSARPVFSLARFEKPERVTFHDCWLGQTLFVNCDVSRLNFSAVKWGRDGKRLRLYEETIALDEEDAKPLKPPKGDYDERNYGLIGETYHQLKVNYDSKGDPWTASEFHYGEMEMKRRSSRWPRLGLTAWYRRTSEYGQSMGRPLAWLLVVLLLFALLYPFTGLRPASAKALPPGAQAVASAAPLSYWNFEKDRGRTLGLVKLWGHSIMAALGVAALQKDFAYFEPNYGVSRLLAVMELVLTTTLVALFLLAVRRKFKR